MSLYIKTTLTASYKMFHKLNSSIIYSTMKFFDKNAHGRIVNRLNNDVNMIDDELPWFGHVLFENIAFTLGYPIGIMI